MELSKATASFVNIIKTNTTRNLERTLAGLMYHALVHGRVELKTLAAAKLMKKESNMTVGKFKSAIDKFLPIDWNGSRYTVNKDKRILLQQDLGIVWRESTYPEVLAIVTGMELFKRVKKSDMTTDELNEKFKAAKLTEAKRIEYLRLTTTNLNLEIAGLEALLESARRAKELKENEIIRSINEAA